MIEKYIDKHITFNQLKESKTALWSMLLFAGYLTSESAIFDEKRGLYKCQLKVPNKEVLTLYNRYIIEWFETNLSEEKYQSILTALADGNIEIFAKKLENYLLQSASFRDTTEKSEQFYHGLVFGLVSGLDNTHVITSNRENGLGLYDLLLVPETASAKKSAIIFEFKHAKKIEDANQIAEKALKQIEDNLYFNGLNKPYPHIKQVVKVGLAFSGKSICYKYTTTNLK